MPAAKDKRQPVGTATCADCETVAAFYQVQRGNRKGYIYKRCECGADQSTGVAKQQKWLSMMARTDHPMLDHPLQVEPEPKNEGEPEKPDEPEPATERAVAEVGGQKENKAVGVLGLLGLAAVALIASIT